MLLLTIRNHHKLVGSVEVSVRQSGRMSKRKRRSGGGSKASPKQNKSAKALKSPKEPDSKRLRSEIDRMSVFSAHPASIASAVKTATNNSDVGDFGGSTQELRAEDMQLQVKVKLPPIMVKSVPLEKLMKTMKALGVSAEYKICRIGTKIMVKSKDDFGKATTYLKSSKTEFFTHDFASEKPFKAVIRGLPEMTIEEIEEELRVHYKLATVGVFRMSRRDKTKTFRDCLYLVHFAKGSVTLNALQAVRSIGSIVVRWEPYRALNRDVTQCQRCLNFGHGTRNCNVKPRCGYCGQRHASIDCLVEGAIEYRCANCDGKHRGSDRSCPKREEYKNIRKKASTQGQAGKTRQEVPVFSASNFPELVPRRPGSETPPIGPPTNRREPTSACLGPNTTHPGPSASRPMAPTSSPWALPPHFSQDGGHPTSSPDQHSSPLFTAEQLMGIFTEMCGKLQQCRTRQDQIYVLGLLVISYGC
ncbi:uncharacterized protein LOC131687306 [Topomyia yanbarensis]|uniref:uncharacterized protein LOC131687306 n=1 Tax=Topomyia yanbarensis TaxID=2498891 RepID=UPI00273C7912|nr:uncharacterized protein LOC131687306 [Topomyia yanbarensis]